MKPQEYKHPEAYEDFHVGDTVYCMGWLGMPFKVVEKDDERQMIFLNGEGPCSLPGGAMIDIDPSALYMLTHNLWDQIWYWPDRAGETYRQVVRRFIARYKHNEVVVGYAAQPAPMPNYYYARKEPELAMSFRLSYDSLEGMQQIHAQPVAAVSDDGKVIVNYDPAIPDARWMPAGPVLPLRIEMSAYRWALLWGRMLLNWYDFEAPADDS